MASAADFTFSAVTAEAKQFQLFQPSAGTSPICAPQMILNSRSAVPGLFLARKVTV